MSTDIPPHNIKDVYRACYKLIEDTKNGIDTDIEDIIKAIKAPDFPTGGQIIGLKGVKEAYRKGKGNFIIRGKYEIEDTKNGSQIIITEIPYRVNKLKLCEAISDHSKNNKIQGIKEIRDESSKDGMRIVIELKKDENPSIVVNNIIKHTDFQKNYSLKMLSLVDKKPHVLNIKEVLNNFLGHCASVIINRTQFDLEKAKKRLNIIQGVMKCISDKDLLDLVVNIVRTADDPEKEILTLGFNEEQVAYIIDMRLRRLSKASLQKYIEEEKELTDKIDKFNSILNDDNALLDQIKSEFEEIERVHGDERRTEISNDVDSIEEEDLIKDETLIITYTTDGIIKAVEEGEYKSQKRGGKGVKATNTKDDEIIKFMFTTNSKDDLLFFTTEGRCHVLKAYKINKTTKSAKGKSINNYLNLNVGEKIVSVLNTNIKNKEKHLLFITKNGQIKKLSLEQLSTRLTVTRVIKFKENDSLVQALLIEDKDNVLIVTSYGMSLRIDTGAEGNKSIRAMGRDAAGVCGISLQEGDQVVDMCIVNDNDNIITVTELGIAKQTKASEWRIIGRGGKGVTAHGLSEKTGRIISVLNSTENDELFIATEKGLITRIEASSIRTCSRGAVGVKAINLNDSDLVASVSINKNVKEEENES